MRRIKVALDANIPERVPRMLNSGFGAAFEFIWEPDFAAAAAKDEHWAETFSRFGGAIAVTGDKNIARRPHQIMAFKECGLISFFCERKWAEQDLPYKMAHLIFWWPRVAERLQSAKPRDAFWVPYGLRGEMTEVRLPDAIQAQHKAATKK